MDEAARLNDPIDHSHALGGFLVGALIGITLVAYVAFATFTCGFGAALLAGVIAGVAGFVAGELIGKYVAEPVVKWAGGGPSGRPVDVVTGTKILLATDEVDVELIDLLPFQKSAATTTAD